MYESYWNFARRPFAGGCDVRAYYPGEAHQGALLKLRYAVENRVGAALLTGHAGTGKSLVARLLFERLNDTCGPLVHLTFPQMPTAELLAFIAVELQAEHATVGEVPSVDVTVRRIERTLLENAAAGRHAVLVVDEAHLLEATRTFEALRLLLNIEHAGLPTLTLILVGQAALLPSLNRLPALEQRLGVKCLLRPLSRDEVHAYVQHRLQAAEGPTSVFDAEALDALYAVTRGVPREINRLCDLALLLGYADEASSIDAERIEAVARELVDVAAE